MKIINSFFFLIVLAAFVDVSHAAESHEADVITKSVEQDRVGNSKQSIDKCHTDTSRLISNADESEANEKHETCVAVPAEPAALGNRVQRVDAHDDDPCGPGVWARTTKIVEGNGSGDEHDASCAERLPSQKPTPAN